MKTNLNANVTALYLASSATNLVKSPTQYIDCALEGLTGDMRHPPGFIKPADGRDKDIARGTPVRNWRQWSAVSVEELQQIAHAMGIEHLDGSYLGTNITFAGCPNLTQIPRGATIWFPSGAVLTVEAENAPCIGPGKAIMEAYPHIDARQFPKAAHHRRGLVGVVYVAGRINVGDSV